MRDRLHRGHKKQEFPVASKAKNKPWPSVHGASDVHVNVKHFMTNRHRSYTNCCHSVTRPPQPLPMESRSRMCKRKNAVSLKVVTRNPKKCKTVCQRDQRFHCNAELWGGGGGGDAPRDPTLVMCSTKYSGCAIPSWQSHDGPCCFWSSLCAITARQVWRVLLAPLTGHPSVIPLDLLILHTRRHIGTCFAKTHTHIQTHTHTHT